MIQVFFCAQLSSTLSDDEDDGRELGDDADVLACGRLKFSGEDMPEPLECCSGTSGARIV